MLIGAYLESCWREQSVQDIVQWADGNLKLPQSVRYPIFMAEEAQWLLEPLRCLSDPNIKRVDVRMPAGAAKSLIGEIFIAWILENEPGPCYYVWQSDDDGKDAVEDRLEPMFMANETLFNKLPTDRHKKRIAKINFRHMPLYIVGANLNAAQSKRIRYLIFEEPHLYKPGMASAFKKRMEGVRGAKLLTLSTGSVLDDESDKDYNDGSCEEWQVPCPSCGHYQTMTDSPDRLRCDKNAETIDENGMIIWHKLLPTVRYNCESCGVDWPKDQSFRREQSQKGRYLATNANARADHRSFHCEAVSVHWIEMATVLEEKLKASSAARRGSIELLKDYVQKRKANAWDESPPDDSKADIERMTGLYIKGDAFPESIATFLTLDNQRGKAREGEGEHRWGVCRAWGENECRLIWEGKIGTWEEVEELRVKLKVPPLQTLPDIAYDLAKVQAMCLRYGWQGLWGDMSQKQNYPHHEIVNGQRITRHLPYSSAQLGNRMEDGKGGFKQARYFWWCNQPIADLYHSLKDGLSSYRMTIAQDTSEEYKKHCAVEYKSRVIGANGVARWIWKRPKHKDDHLLDADQMNLVAALMHPRLRPLLYSFKDEPMQVQGNPENQVDYVLRSLTPA